MECVAERTWARQVEGEQRGVRPKPGLSGVSLTVRLEAVSEGVSGVGAR